MNTRVLTLDNGILINIGRYTMVESLNGSIKQETQIFICGSTGIDTTVPTNTVQVPNTYYRYSNGQRFCVYYIV